ncbi:hypothetical protein FA15DRAFT_641814 [Coprinopsis marcescibilis]|uniref:Uncharacterized protein n=1 Tax=Coprinopsis marcescibilis TaxID=230819 RepID=A0A5C3KUP5_COPMA|nr:hypothetical protein FA15DRAFT_641814 [Coprinopsis marcescibilis]
MSHSTTSTSSYIIQKYSKSHNKPNAQTQQGNDWQHFTNPVMRAVLDKTKNHRGEVDSLRLRIIWSMNEADDDTGFQQNPEDLDLFSFSALKRNKPQKHHMEGLPLKAVYRDTVVCIRYMHSTTQTHRRFQISFGSLIDANSFVNSIKPVCPCKLLPPNPQSSGPMLNHAGTMVPNHAPNTLSSEGSGMQRSTTVAKPGLDDHASGSLQYQRSDTMLPMTSEPDYEFESNAAYGPGSTTSATATNQSAMGPPNFLPNNRKNTMATVGSHTTVHNSRLSQASSQLPPSSPFPSSSDKGTAYSSPEDNLDRPEEDMALLESLREATALYGMPAAQLENIVAEVIREDGFVRLMEKLSSMWRIHSLMGAEQYSAPMAV